MEPGLIWILAGLLLLVAELILPGIFLLWVGLAAIGTGLVQMVTVTTFAMDATSFLVLLGAGIWLSLTLRQSRPPRGARVNAPGAGLIGRSGMLLPVERHGLRVRIGDSDWPARLPRDMRVPEGPVQVRVEGVDGTTLIVKPE
ncbi:NfeD family protein [Siccirubricoccus phaeus]|uniref:NfeD family protein n=1 Tax=Siccirubricoccus phaeus TaxID=2595053 RepID=UPI0011F3CE16|nr:NfeD family protein [Siccirubricoccus phaeus]